MNKELLQKIMNKGETKGLDSTSTAAEWVELAVDELKREIVSEPMSLCLDCNNRWDGLIKQCEHCGAKYSEEPYMSKIEYYVYYDDVKEAFNEEDLLSNTLIIARRLKYIEHQIRLCLADAEKAGDRQEALGYKTALCIIKNSEDEERIDYDEKLEAEKK